MPIVVGQQSLVRDWRAAAAGDGYAWRYDAPGLSVLAIDSATQGGELRYLLPDQSWVSFRLTPTPTGQSGSIVGDTLSVGPVTLQVQELAGGFVRVKYTFTAQTKSQVTYNWTVATGAGPSGRSATFTLLADGSAELRDGNGQLAYTQIPPTAVDRNGTTVAVSAAFSAGTLTYTPADIATNRYPLAIDPTTVSTTTSTAALVANQSPHIYTMSNGDLAALYYNGTNWVWQVKTSGAWGTATTITGATTTGTPLTGSSCRNGDTLYLATGPGSTGGNEISKLVFSTSGHSFTVTSGAFTGDILPVDSLYYDTTHGYVHGLINLGGGTNSYMCAVLGSTLGPGIGDTLVTGSPGTSASQFECLVGDGTSTIYAITGSSGSSTIAVTKAVAGASAYTMTAETGVPALAAALTGISAIYDGTNIVIVANQNNAKLRYCTRTAANTYSAWTDLDTNTIGNPPAITRDVSTGDLGVAYKRTSGQANGEIYTLLRLSGAWGSPTLLAGSASTGWQLPSAAPNDSNESAGVVRLVYLTGTASPWSLVEDTYTIASGVAPSLSQISIGPIGASAAASGSKSAGEWAWVGPVADVVIGGWTDQNNNTTDLHSPIGEAGANDTTYDVGGYLDLDTFEVRLSRFQVPNPANSYTLSYRFQKEAYEGQELNLTVELRQGDSLRIAQWLHGNISGDLIQADRTLSTAQLVKITDPTDVRVRVTVSHVNLA